MSTTIKRRPGRPPGTKKWNITDDIRERIVAYLKDGKDRNEIARLMKLPHGIVCEEATAAGWSKKRQREELAHERDEKIADAIRGGKLPAELCKEYGVSFSTVRNACCAHGVTINSYRHYSSEHAENVGHAYRILALLLAGHSILDIATECGVTRQRVHQLMQKAEECGFQFGTGTITFTAEVPKAAMLRRREAT
jgi:hypothetical protein